MSLPMSEANLHLNYSSVALLSFHPPIKLQLTYDNPIEFSRKGICKGLLLPASGSNLGIPWWSLTQILIKASPA